MQWAWVRHNMNPREFLNMKPGEKTILLAMIEKEIEDEQGVK